VVLALVGRSTSRVGVLAYGVLIVGLMAFLTPSLVYVALAAKSGDRVLAASLEIVALGVYGFLVGGITLSIVAGLRPPHPARGPGEGRREVPDGAWPTRLRDSREARRERAHGQAPAGAET